MTPKDILATRSPSRLPIRSSAPPIEKPTSEPVLIVEGVIHYPAARTLAERTLFARLLSSERRGAAARLDRVSRMPPKEGAKCAAYNLF
jgi:hypothetical protein